MAKPRVLILRAPGTNCDPETAFAFDRAGGQSQVVHLNRLVEKPDLVNDFQILCIPGGFSFGDDIAAGRIFAQQMQHHVADALHAFRSQEKLVLGICNGFQVLINTGLLLSAEESEGRPATLTWNDCRKYEDRWVQLSCDSRKCVFLDGVDAMYLPIAHAEGRFVARCDKQLQTWSEQGQLALRYSLPAEQQGKAASGSGVPYPWNPNGSMADVAGVCDASGRIFGMMPHPERFIEPIQHPRWTREPNREVGDGLAIFQNAIKFFG